MKKTTEKQDQQWSQTMIRVKEMNAIYDHMRMVKDCRDRISALAEELQADEFRVTWSIEDEFGNGQVEYQCSVGIQMPHYWMGSYVSAKHPFEKAEASIREMHSEWKREQDKKQLKAEQERIKQALYDDYLAQKSHCEAK